MTMVRTTQMVDGLTTGLKDLSKSTSSCWEKPHTTPLSFVASKGVVRMKIVFEDPFARDDIGTGRTGNQRPCLVLREIHELVHHGLSLVRIPKGNTICHRYGGDKGVNDGEVELVNGSDNARLSVTLHMVRARCWTSNRTLARGGSHGSCRWSGGRGRRGAGHGSSRRHVAGMTAYRSRGNQLLRQGRGREKPLPRQDCGQKNQLPW